MTKLTMRKSVILVVFILLISGGCTKSDPQNDGMTHCTKDYVASTYFHHSTIQAISLRLMQNTPDRIQVHEIGDQLSMYYCNLETKTEILLAEYKVIKVTDNQDNEIRPHQTTMPTESPIDETNGHSAIRYVQLMQDFQSKFIQTDDINYYNTNKLGNLPFVISTMCSDTYRNTAHEVSNFSGSVSSSITLNNPPSQVQLVKEGDEIRVLYCVFNETSDRSVVLGTLLVMNTQQVDYENTLVTERVFYPIVVDETSGYGVYFGAGQMPYMREYVFNTLLHTESDTQNLIEQYKATIFDNNTIKLDFKTNGLIYSNPY